MEELNRQTRELAHHQRLEMMGMLTSGIAHEFNNMLTPIMGYSMMIIEKLPQEDSEIYDEVLEIYQMSSKAKTVISRLSDLSRKNTETVFKRVPIDELVRRMISAAKSARPNDVDVQLELKCPEAAVYGNETQLSQLLLNLIINSYHALEATGGTLEILTEVKDNEVVLKVRDDGYGISKEHLPHIFEPFFTTKETGKGTGLGMAIVAQVVEDHHGRILVESEEGKGTEMTVIFPKMEEKTEES
jgi:signal transduction histidine kinase